MKPVCVRKRAIPGDKDTGPRLNPEAWCGNRFDHPCANCDAKGRVFNGVNMERCVDCNGRKIEPFTEPHSSLESALNGPTCKGCLAAIREAFSA